MGVYYDDQRGKLINQYNYIDLQSVNGNVAYGYFLNQQVALKSKVYN